MSRIRAARIVALAVLALIVTIAATGARGSDLPPVYETRTPSGNGIGKIYMGREIANVMSHRRMSRLDRPGRERGVDNIETLLGRVDDPGLGEHSADLIFIVDAYHEFSHPREMGEAMYKALRPGGHLIVVEDRAEAKLRSSGALHNMSEAQARKEITALGFRWLRTESFLPQQHFLVFQKSTSP